MELLKLVFYAMHPANLAQVHLPLIVSNALTTCIWAHPKHVHLYQAFSKNRTNCQEFAIKVAWHALDPAPTTVFLAIQGLPGALAIVVVQDFSN
jgi:hypothetical protein